MAAFAFFECTAPSCRLRFPLDKQAHKGEFCPRCGGKLQEVPVERAQSGLPQDIARRRMIGVLDNIRSAHNVGGIFRTADGVGAAHLYLCGITPTPGSHPEIAKTALGAEQTLTWSAHPNALEAAKNLQAEGVFLLALEHTEQAVSIQDFSLSKHDHQAIALVVGHERAGVDPALLNLCDAIITLPMSGQKRSLNVVVAFGVGAYWLAFN